MVLGYGLFTLALADISLVRSAMCLALDVLQSSALSTAQANGSADICPRRSLGNDWTLQLVATGKENGKG